MIPAWKLRRELQRLGQQLRAIPEAIWEPFARRAHDAALDRGFPLHDGALPVGPKIALVLCWQPKGLAPSFLDMLDHLVATGYAPFVVSNAALTALDRQSLHPRSWRVVERPNFGYDFGGYRDGLTMLRRWGHQPDRLVILNDSVWFPIWPEDQTLQKAESAPFDVTGTILRERDGQAFLESYFFSIRGPVLDNPSFRAFWDGLRLTSNKYKVIRRGERGFGLALHEAGISMGPLFPQAEFEAALAGLDETGLRKVLSFAALVDPKDAATMAGLVTAPATAEWEPAARSFISQVIEKNQIYSAFPILAAGYLGYSVLKKSAEPVSAAWRAAFLRGVDRGALPPPLPSVAIEAKLANAGRAA